MGDAIIGAAWVVNVGETGGAARRDAPPEEAAVRLVRYGTDD